MSRVITYADENRIAQILQELTELSKEMNKAVHQKDLAKIEQVHLKKEELINKLNLLIIAQQSSDS